MSNVSKPINNIAKAVRLVRTSRGLSQEDFGAISSRTYVSSIERRVRAPTLNKLDDLAEVMEVHPLTLLTLSYLQKRDRAAVAKILARIADEISEIE